MKTEKDKEQQCRWNYVRAVGNGMEEGGAMKMGGGVKLAPKPYFDGSDT